MAPTWQVPNPHWDGPRGPGPRLPSASSNSNNQSQVRVRADAAVASGHPRMRPPGLSAETSSSGTSSLSVSTGHAQGSVVRIWIPMRGAGSSPEVLTSGLCGFPKVTCPLWALTP